MHYCSCSTYCWSNKGGKCVQKCVNVLCHSGLSNIILKYLTWFFQTCAFLSFSVLRACAKYASTLEFQLSRSTSLYPIRNCFVVLLDVLCNVCNHFCTVNFLGTDRVLIFIKYLLTVNCRCVATSFSVK